MAQASNDLALKEDLREACADLVVCVNNASQDVILKQDQLDRLKELIIARHEREKAAAVSDQIVMEGKSDGAIYAETSRRLATPEPRSFANQTLMLVAQEACLEEGFVGRAEKLLDSLDASTGDALVNLSNYGGVAIELLRNIARLHRSGAASLPGSLLLHADHLAKSAEGYMEVVNMLHSAMEGDGDEEVMLEKFSDHGQGLRIAVHEFRKRYERFGLQTTSKSLPSPAEVAVGQAGK